MIRTVKRFDRGNYWLEVDTTSGERVVREVPKRGGKGPGLVRKAANLTRAAAKHVKAGAPRASDAVVAARFAVCKSNRCGLFRPTSADGGECSHATCGCALRAVGAESKIAPNKLRWADQACPVGLWKVVPPDAGG